MKVRLRKRGVRQRLAARLLSAILGCAVLPAHAAPPPAPDAARIGGVVECRIEVATGTSRCLPRAPGPDARWRVEVVGAGYTPADSTYRLNVRIVNEAPDALGTADGTRVTGIKAFLSVPPVGYDGSAEGDTADPLAVPAASANPANHSVQARNPDARQSFTRPLQPYWLYDQIVAPGGASGWREWQLTAHPGVSYIYLAVSIFAMTPGESWQRTGEVPRGWLISQDSVDRLYAADRRVTAHPRLQGPYPRNVLHIIFQPTATLEERRAALDLSGGSLIGGSGGVLFHLVVPDDGTADPLWAAIDRVSGLPQVMYAGPDLLTSGFTAL